MIHRHNRKGQELKQSQGFLKVNAFTKGEIKKEGICIFPCTMVNGELPPGSLIRLCCHRGRMENFIQESKRGFDFEPMSIPSMTVNVIRLQLSALAYNLFHWFRRITLPTSMRMQ